MTDKMISFGINVNKNQAKLTINNDRMVGFARSYFNIKKQVQKNEDTKTSSNRGMAKWGQKC